MDNLYVSDLDGTLLRSDQTISDDTISIINALVNKGMHFSYATARSLVTAKKVTKGISAKIPLIVYNGAFVMDNVTGEILIANFFDHTVHDILDDLFHNSVYPIVYAFHNGKETFSFVPKLCTAGLKEFLETRKGDPRRKEVETTSALKEGQIFYITCIDEPEKLEPLYKKYKNHYHCLYQTDIYTQKQWLEIMPREASKSNAVRQLQALLNCKKLIVFGDGKNDIDMFQLADESYAVANADPQLKKYATDILGSNDEDAVAKWLLANYQENQG